MTIAEYLAKLDAAGKAEAMQNAHIWSDEAAAGYAIAAMMKAALPTNQIREVVTALKEELETRTIERAEWMYKGSKGLL